VQDRGGVSVEGERLSRRVAGGGWWVAAVGERV
jgi:hypothetical protein